MCWIYILSVVLYSYVCNYMSLQKSLSSIKIVGFVLFSTTVRLSFVSLTPLSRRDVLFLLS